MILKASHHPVIYPFFRFYTIWKIKRNFHDVIITGEFNEKELPILLISNHVSWWDGFWAEYLNIKIFHRKFYFMMLEEQLRNHMFLNKTGGFSVRKGVKSIIETLDYTNEILSDKKNLVLMFPQGKIDSIHNQKIEFEKGIEYILKRKEREIQIIFLVSLIDYFSESRPGLYIYFKEYQGSETDTNSMQNEFNKFYSECVGTNIQKSR